MTKMKKKFPVINTNDPWVDLSPPARADNVTALRVDEKLKWDMFWAVDLQRNYLLILQYQTNPIPTTTCQNLKVFR